MRQLLLAAGIAVGMLLLAALFYDPGEIVMLETTDAEGHAVETPLWIVEVDGQLYLRGFEGSGWMRRLRARPLVEVSRNGDTRSYKAVPVATPEVAEAVDRAMAEKYDTADRILTWFHPSGSAPVLLESVGVPEPKL